MTVVNTDDFAVQGASNAVHPNDNQARANVGTEVILLDQFFLCGGYIFGYDTEAGTFGAGVVAPFGGTAVTFDYSSTL